MQAQTAHAQTQRVECGLCCRHSYLIMLQTQTTCQSHLVVEHCFLCSNCWRGSSRILVARTCGCTLCDCCCGPASAVTLNSGVLASCRCGSFRHSVHSGQCSRGGARSTRRSVAEHSLVPGRHHCLLVRPCLYLCVASCLLHLLVSWQCHPCRRLRSDGCIVEAQGEEVEQTSHSITSQH